MENLAYEAPLNNGVMPLMCSQESYEEIIRSWGYLGQVSNILAPNDSMLQFLCDGYISTCPAESEKLHKERVAIVSKIEACFLLAQ